MNDRVILAIRYTPAGVASEVRKAVGGFLRYVQHRDLLPNQPAGRPRPEVSGLLKYVAYRDRATTRAELFGPSGTLNSEDRKAFASFVANALDRSNPQLFRSRDGRLQDRRRAVYRLVISPERASGLNLRGLATAAVGRLEAEIGIDGLPWIAAIHRNTKHHHVHLVIAGMHEESPRRCRRVDITKPRLAAMKMALGLEIERQRNERIPLPQPEIAAPAAKSTPSELPSREATQVVSIIAEDTAPITQRFERPLRARSATHLSSVVALRAAARRYQRRMQRELEESYRQNQWEYAA